MNDIKSFDQKFQKNNFEITSRLFKSVKSSNAVLPQIILKREENKKTDRKAETFNFVKLTSIKI